ncbi:MAG: hypothetical protein JXR16_01515 [Bermanella sp.]
MSKLDVYRSVAKYYVRLKLEEAAKLAYKKGDMEAYKKYQQQLKKITKT